ncbi:hypothetical protein Hanom_Chr11g01033891 [Helianthus anomalus]
MTTFTSFFYNKLYNHKCPNITHPSTSWNSIFYLQHLMVAMSARLILRKPL